MNNAKLRNFMTSEESDLSTRANSDISLCETFLPRNGKSLNVSDTKNCPEIKNILLPKNFSSSPSRENLSMVKTNEERSFKELDSLFVKLRCKINPGGVDKDRSEKLNFSRAINFIFKNNLIETQVKDIKINKLAVCREEKEKLLVKGGEGTSQGIIYKTSEPNVGLTEKSQNSQINQVINPNSLNSKMLKISSNPQLLNAPKIKINPSQEVNFSLDSLNVDRKLNGFSVPSKVFTNPQQNLEKRKKRANVGSNLFHVEDKGSITNSINELEFSKKLIEKANALKNAVKESKQNIPINVKSFPSPISINTQNPNNFHVNMNITNININKPQPFSDKVQMSTTCDRDLKLINELKETLKKKFIRYTEEHSTSNYILKFKIPFEGISKQYHITIDQETKKINNYEKYKGEDKVIVINNTEESDANLIFNDLSCLKKDLELMIV